MVKKSSKKITHVKKAKDFISEIKLNEEREYGTKELIQGILVGLIVGFIIGILLFKGGA